MKINKIWNWVVASLSPTKPQPLALVEEFVCCSHREGRGSLVTKLPGGEPLNEMIKLKPGVLIEDIERDELEKIAEAQRIAEKDALELQKTIIEWQKLAGIQPEKTLDLLIPIKEGKTERRRSVNFKSTPDMVAYLKAAGFVPYDLDYIEEARTGKYRFIRIKKQEVKNFFEFPDATFNGPEFYKPYTSDDARPIVYGPYLAPHQLSNPVPITAQVVEANDGKISVLSPLQEHAHEWKNDGGVFTPKTEIDYLKEVEKPAEDWLTKLNGMLDEGKRKK